MSKGIENLPLMEGLIMITGVSPSSKDSFSFNTKVAASFVNCFVSPNPVKNWGEKRKEKQNVNNAHSMHPTDVAF